MWRDADQGMVLRSQPRRRSIVTIIKVTYILCSVALTTSFIVGAFLVHMLVLPYFHESEFQPGVCAVVKMELHHGGRLKCENKCSKERSSFPCLRVTINFEKDHVNRTGLLFDTIVTHQNYRNFGVGNVTSDCSFFCYSNFVLSCMLALITERFLKKTVPWNSVIFLNCQVCFVLFSRGISHLVAKKVFDSQKCD